ncbi:MAG: M20/M25/M40 family metallo-hydrolase [Sphingomonadaceae bacterium]|nr:M20/M25/M40 family metallo-hydrolase [Sphingomonadaceae bacterium]MCP5384715.1 M20/M25/M40 family metallo-hydrolase [Altererythrobacter sp.]MCP5391930.1 M20/M25/M40 family metallo-hydrolase [Sphingomonadaceae bacterium]MCP5393909.1 M20/M25/M40 family metallo-hydrolase [Sphingomonadaceae bacterium]
MNRLALALAALSLPIPVAVSASNPDMTLEEGADRVLDHDKIAWDFVEGITTEVGPRQAGTEAEARGREWASNWMRANGFDSVAIEPFEMETWVPGDTHKAEILSPFAQPLVVQPLGGSASTGPEGITAEVVYFRTVDELRAAPDGSLKGKIAYISHSMTPTQDGSQYGFAGPARWVGSGIAASKGALATVIKSVGTDNHRNPHTGGAGFPDGVAPTPAGALPLPDAANLERMFERAGGKPITMKLTLTPKQLGTTMSGNVVGEIAGRDPSLPPVLVACHIDSWWNGTGAFDDGAGCGIVAAAALHVRHTGKPLRTIRVLMAGAEETGLWGSKAYSAAHIADPIAVGLESDFGADRIWQFQSNFREANPDLHAKIASSVARFGVSNSTMVANGGADINIARDQKTAIIDLQQDGTRYFDLHHTPDDTLDKIDPVQLRQNVAVWTQVVGILANEPGEILPKE